MSYAQLPRGTLVYFIVKAVPAASALGGVVLFIHLGGPSTYGMYSVAYAAAAFTTSLGSGWLLQAALRFAGDAAASWPMIARWSVWASTLVAGTAAFVLCALTLREDNIAFSVGAGLLATAIATQALVVTLLQSGLAPGLVLRAESLRAVLQFVLPVGALLLLVRTGMTVLFAMAVATGLAVLPFHRRLHTTSGLIRASALRAWWSYGWPMSLWLSLASVLQYADRILIAHWRGAAEAGAYAGVYDVLNGGLAVCLFPVTMAAFPRISTRWNSGDRAGAMQENRIAIRAQIALFVPVLIAAALLRRTLTQVLLSTTAPRVVDTVIPILLGAFCWQLALSVHKRLELERRTQLMLLFAVTAATANVAANVLTIREYGGLAAAWTTFGSAALYLLLCWGWQIAHFRPVPADVAAPAALVHVEEPKETRR